MVSNETEGDRASSISPEPETERDEIVQLAQAWVRNGGRVHNWQLVSCGLILLDRLGEDTAKDEALLRELIAREAQEAGPTR